MCGCSNKTICTCSQTQYTADCAGCSYTINSDCVIFKGNKLSFEPLGTKDGSARTLTTLLSELEALNCCQKESKIISDSYTVLPEDTEKLLLLKGTLDDISGGELALTLTLPVDIAFANKTLTFKDISGVGTGGRVVGWYFGSTIQYQWSPSVLTSTSYQVLSEQSTSKSVHRVLRLTFVKIDSVNYAWLVI